LNETTQALRRVFDQLFGPSVAEEIIAGDGRPHPAWDSVAQINLVMAIEQRFGITFSPEEAGMTTSFESIRDLVEAKLASRTA